MNNKLEEIDIKGLTLSSLLGTVISKKHDSEGFLYGRVIEDVESVLQDYHEDVLTNKRTRVSITSTVSNHCSRRFYNSVGCVQVDHLVPPTILPDKPGGELFLGWFSHRINRKNNTAFLAGAPADESNGLLQITDLERDVCKSLACAMLDDQIPWAHRGRRIPVLFLLLLSDLSSHDQATLTVKYSLFQVVSSTPNRGSSGFSNGALQVIPVPRFLLRNLGGQAGDEKYQKILEESTLASVLDVRQHLLLNRAEVEAMETQNLIMNVCTEEIQNIKVEHEQCFKEEREMIYLMRERGQLQEVLKNTERAIRDIGFST